jgi:hypothetical protein
MDDLAGNVADALELLAVFLAKHARPGPGLTFWVDWVSKDAKRASAGDYSGVDHFLAAFGGMGSLKTSSLVPTPPNSTC